jgi:hypothetical protein
MKTSPRIYDFDATGNQVAKPLLPVPLRIVAHGVRNTTGNNWNRRVRDWMQS